ncbi:MAG: CocE/NonD family hydrolase, partial [Terracidiphilus sp.]
FLGKQNQFADASKPVRIFVMGADEWRDEGEWPLKRAKETRYLLGSNGKANGAAGDGLLTTAAAKSAPSDVYIYDPANPVPTTGGPLCCDGGHLAPGPQDQQKVEARPDVLVYSTGPLEQDVEVTVAPDGTAINLTEGILRARYREDTKGAPKPITPGEVYEYKIDLWSTSNVFLKGHRIRLEVSSSNFPRFDRNLNTGKDAATSAEMMKATNTIYHDAQHPSALVLPVVE